MERMEWRDRLDRLEGLERRDRPGGGVAFPGGGLEGRRPRGLCGACRGRVRELAASGAPLSRPGTLCFACHQADVARERAIREAGQLDTASPERFQTLLPFEPVNTSRLTMLRAEREAAQASRRQDTRGLEARR